MPVSSAAAAAGACCLRLDAACAFHAHSHADRARDARLAPSVLRRVYYARILPPDARLIDWLSNEGSFWVYRGFQKMAANRDAFSQSVTRLAVEWRDSREFENSLFDSQSRDMRH